MKRLYLPFLFAFTHMSCATIWPSTPDVATPCAQVCANMRALGCLAARPTADGASCEIVCANFQKGPAPWDLSCRVTAKSCAAMDCCEVGR
jgi:hypothetical protein